MIDWKVLEPKIVAMDKEGLSSTQIAKVLSETDERIKPTRDRQVRKVLQRYREVNGLDTGRNPAKILVFDIETAPMIGYFYNPKTRYITSDKVIQDWYVICWSAKWLFGDTVINACVTPSESKRQDDKRIVKEMWKLFDEADIVIAHNGDRFDIRKMNTRFALYGLNLPSPYQTIDTYKAARRRLSLSYYSLSYIAEYYNVPHRKQDTRFKLWRDCVTGDVQALNDMQEYCDQDIRVLEDVYLIMRPFIQPHPNLGLYIASGATVCPSCASTNLKEEGQYMTTVNVYQAFRCGDCGSLTRSRHSKLTQEEKETITSSLPR